MMKKDDPNRKNRRKNKTKNKPKVKPKINNNDMYDISTYFNTPLLNLADSSKQIFADGVQRILDRAEAKNK